ncbi:helix-turn-helix transcriptional regulator [Avibacterium sp. 20-126]|uniref:winged helix-turn-helix transcriptional regulator n=1 Tax=Avibacterium sp. 20-126 TaxID=2911524 RepID=UPI00218B35A8|nr:helix-turn-helix transcriptional regulator [Avibacterium sp. 20-126]
MLKETDKKLPDCEVEITLMMMSERWRVLIIRELLSGTKRFGELKKTLNGISQKVLTANLRAMESQGLLTRKVYAEVPPRVEYTLTEDGISLKSVLDAMAMWGESYRQKYQNR